MRLSTLPSQSLSMPSFPTGSIGSFVSNAHGLTSESWSLQSPLQVVQPSPSASTHSAPSDICPSENPSNSYPTSTLASSPLEPELEPPELEPEPELEPLPELDAPSLLESAGPSMACESSPPLLPPSSDVLGLLFPHAPDGPTSSSNPKGRTLHRATREDRRIIGFLRRSTFRSGSPPTEDYQCRDDAK